MLLHTIFGVLTGLSIGGFMGMPVVLLLLDNRHKEKEAEAVVTSENFVSVFPTPESTTN